jgi:hypothetical protein
MLLALVVLAFGVIPESDLRADEPAAEKPKAKPSAWKAPLEKALADADRLLIEPLSATQKKGGLEIKGADRLRELLKRIEIDDERSGFACLCDGDHLFHFYKGDRLVVTLGHHHGIGLRWRGGSWEGDAALTPDSQVALPRWFREYGYPRLQEMRDARLQEAKAEAEKRAKFYSCFSEKARKQFEKEERSGRDFIGVDESQGRRLSAAIGDGATIAVSVCRAFGTLADYESSWSSTTGKVRLALSAVHAVTGNEFFSALKQLKDDKPGLLGAARLFFFHDFANKLPAEVRADWAARLAEVTLTDGWDGNKPIALRGLRRADGPAARALLQRVRRGETGKEIDRDRPRDDEPGIRATAALLLVQLGEKNLTDELKRDLAVCKVKEDRAAYEVSLSLLGDPAYLKADQFKLMSFTIGNAGLEAIERFKGEHGLEALIEGGIHHPWAAVQHEAINVFQRITGRNWGDEQIESWWAEGADGKNPRPTIKNVGLMRRWERGATGQPVLALRPDGRQFAVSHGREIVLISVVASAKEKTLKGHTLDPRLIHYSPDGSQLVSAGYDKTIRVWDVRSGKELRAAAFDDKELMFYVSAEGVLLGVEQQKRSLHIRDLADDKEFLKLELPAQGGMGFALCAATKRWATGWEGTLTVWDATTGKKQSEFAGRAGNGLQFSRSGRWLLGHGDPSTTVVWDAATGARQLGVKFSSQQGGRDNFAFSPDEKHLVAGNRDGYVRVFDLTSGQQLAEFRAHVNAIERFAFSADGKVLVTATWWGSVKIWDVEKILTK